MQTAVLAVDESFKCLRFKKPPNSYVELINTIAAAQE